MLGLCGFLEHEKTIENQQFRFMPLGLLGDRFCAPSLILFIYSDYACESDISAITLLGGFASVRGGGLHGTKLNEKGPV
jgi:hypothetical protein